MRSTAFESELSGYAVALSGRKDAAIKRKIQRNFLLAIDAACDFFARKNTDERERNRNFDIFHGRTSTRVLRSFPAE